MSSGTHLWCQRLVAVSRRFAVGPGTSAWPLTLDFPRPLVITLPWGSSSPPLRAQREEWVPPALNSPEAEWLA